jgi:DNA-binding CsgD family transcriptional regulator
MTVDPPQGGSPRSRAHVLFGRSGERARLDAAVRDDAAQLVLIDGEPGVGKTRLMEYLVERAQAAGRVVLAGGATEFERLVPFGMYVDAFTRLSDEQPTAAAGPGDLAEAALQTLLSAGDSGGRLDRFHTYRGIRALLAHLAAGPGAVLALDDVHWADAPSLELTEFLLRRPPAGLLIAVASRSALIPPVVADALARSDAATSRLSVGPLDESAADQLVPSTVDPQRRRLLHRVSGGNPLFLRALLDADESTVAELAEGRPGATLALEQTLLGVLRRELDRLSPAGQLAAHAAAVAGELASPAVIAHVAEFDAATSAAAVDELCRHGLGTLAASRLVFRHPLVRAAAYDTCGAGWRVAAHARMAEHLRRTDGPLALLAHHTERCAEPGDEQAARTLGRAGVAYVNSAPASAARMLREALRVLPERADLVPLRAHLLTRLAKATGVMGSLADSRRILQQVIALSPEAAPAAVAFSSVVARMLGRLDEARAVVSAQVRRPGTDPRVRAQLLIELAAVAVLRADPADARRHAIEARDQIAQADARRHAIEARDPVAQTDARRHATEARDPVAQTDDPALASAAYAALAMACLQDGDVTAARAHSRRAGWLVDGASDLALMRRVELVAPLSWGELVLGRPADADRHLGRGIELATMSGHSHAMPYLLLTQAQLHARAGRLAEAIEIGEHAAAVSSSIGSSETLAMARCVMLLPVLWRHGPAAATVLADQITEAPPGSDWWRAMAQAAVARVRLAAGQPARGPAEPAARARDTEATRLAVLSLRSTVEGNVHSALAAARAAVEAATAAGLAYELGVAYDAYARALRGHDPAAATGAARAAIAHFEACGAGVERGLAHQFSALLCTSPHEMGLGLEQIAEAKSAFRQAGADWLGGELLRVERRLAARGPRNADRTLTTRERQVAELIVEGCTNREVAERLRLSQKTVETHVTRIFSKLDVRSRVALARRLAGAGDG